MSLKKLRVSLPFVMSQFDVSLVCIRMSSKIFMIIYAYICFGSDLPLRRHRHAPVECDEHEAKGVSQRANAQFGCTSISKI
ncbi:hypothetical protein IF2G_08288 [Cordyceps javanica]|nr:hypothetical protein IF2G_08288 [Cordyceps javanica]